MNDGADLMKMGHGVRTVNHAAAGGDDRGMAHGNFTVDAIFQALNPSMPSAAMISLRRFFVCFWITRSESRKS